MILDEDWLRILIKFVIDRKSGDAMMIPMTSRTRTTYMTLSTSHLAASNLFSALFMCVSS
ncbi:Uncharacterised protein [Mycobacteroides abscessus subsp. abscessus]|nr:Uncharacterised protein [Mycobacteroides abscessus subsp. abscessus]